jgi:hypothetical protein
MKVERVILATNNNPLYYDFWNNLSFTYKKKFGVEPTLIFFGTEEELETLNLSKEHGTIIVQKPVPDIQPWQYTWGLFYFTKMFEDDVCAIMGIDQIPMGTYFLKDVIKDVPEDNYVMLIDDQYKMEGKSKFTWYENGYSPSAYHIAKGSTFYDIYDFEDTFEEEIMKLQNMDIVTMWGDKWGMDESYSCRTLMKYPYKRRISALSKSSDFLKRRVDCYRNMEAPYNQVLLKNNFYIECHACRPYSEHTEYLDTMFNSIPYFVDKDE